MTQELKAGQVWVPTKGKARQLWHISSIKRHPELDRVGWMWSTMQYPRYCWPRVFRAWITRTGAVLREKNNV